MLPRGFAAIFFCVGSVLMRPASGNTRDSGFSLKCSPREPWFGSGNGLRLQSIMNQQSFE